MSDAAVPSTKTTCQYCLKQFADKTKLGRHQKRSSCAQHDPQAQRWTCSNCNLQLPSKIQFLGHQKDSTCSGSKWQCSRCKKELACKRMVTRHIKSRVCVKACDSCVANSKISRCDAAKVEGPCSICRQMGIFCAKSDGTKDPSPVQVSQSRYEIVHSTQQMPTNSLDNDEEMEDDEVEYINSTPDDFARAAVPAPADTPDADDYRAPTPIHAPAPAASFGRNSNVFGHQLGLGFQHFGSPYAADPVVQPGFQSFGAISTQGLSQSALFRSSHQMNFGLQGEAGGPQPLQPSEPSSFRYAPGQYESAEAFGRDMHRGLPEPTSSHFQTLDGPLEQRISGLNDPWPTTVLTRENSSVLSGGQFGYEPNRYGNQPWPESNTEGNLGPMRER